MLWYGTIFCIWYLDALCMPEALAASCMVDDWNNKNRKLGRGGTNSQRREISKLANAGGKTKIENHGDQNREKQYGCQNDSPDYGDHKRLEKGRSLGLDACIHIVVQTIGT